MQPSPKTLKIGNLSLSCPFFQAPLSGYSDKAMNLLALEYGAPLVFNGLMLDKSVLYPGVLDKPPFDLDEQLHPVGGQLLGNDPRTMAQAARRLVEQGYDVIDLNFACPAPKVTQKQRGGFLLNHPERVISIIQQVRQAIKCPLLIKLRIGYEQTPQSYDNVRRICRDALAEGVDALVIHGRTVGQRYSSRANWEHLAALKQEFSRGIIIGSGDIYSAVSIKNRLSRYNLDGVLVARGAIGNPWIFRQARALLTGTEMPALPDIAEQGKVLLRHFEMILDLYPLRKAIPYFRKFIVYYTKHHKQRKKVLLELISATSADEIRSSIKYWYLPQRA